MFRREQNDARGVQMEVQDPSERLKLIATVLSLSPETARRAVDYAIQRSGEQSGNGRVQRGCRTLVDDVVKQFPPADRAAIFPRSALQP